MLEPKLWYSPSTLSELAWLIPFVFWLVFNTIVFKIAYRRWKEGKHMDSDIMRLSIPTAEMVLFATMVLLHLPVCVFGLFLQNQRLTVCGYATAFIIKMTRYVVTYTTTAIIIDLYGSITDPLETKRARLLHKFRAWKIVAFIWFLSSLLSVPRLFPYSTKVILSNASSVEEREREILHARLFHFFQFVTQYFLPLFIITPMCMRIVVILHSRRRLNARASPRSQYAIVAIVALSFVCLSPYHLYRFFVIVLPPRIDFVAIQSVSHITTKFMFFMFPLNALLYWGLHPDFVDSVKELFRSLKKHRWTVRYDKGNTHEVDSFT